MSSFSRQRREAALKFRSSLFKGLRQSNARSVGRRSQAAKLLIVRKRHRRVNFGVAERGEPHKWGVPLSLHGHILFHYPLFSLMQEAQRKKLGKKEMPHTHHGVAVAPLLRLCGNFRPLRRATAALGGPAKPFEKGLSENFNRGCSRGVVLKTKTLWGVVAPQRVSI